jgi:hypothetical protein
VYDGPAPMAAGANRIARASHRRSIPYIVCNFTIRSVKKA